MKRVLNKLKSLYLILIFLIRNVYNALLLPQVKTIRFDNYYIHALDRKRIKAAIELYERLSIRKKMPPKMKLLYWLIGKKLCIIATNNKGRLIGAGFYYFNKRDIKDKTIHQTFTGVVENMQRKGIVTQIRTHAINNFAKSFIEGVSSRVNINNEPSLAINLKIGFKIVEEYYDEKLGVKRYYLVYRFKENIANKDV